MNSTAILNNELCVPTADVEFSISLLLNSNIGVIMSFLDSCSHHPGRT